MVQKQYITECEGGVLLSLYVIPKSSKNQIVGEYQGRLKVKLQAPPVDGKANQALCKFLGKVFKISTNRVLLQKGETSKSKSVKLVGLMEKEVAETLSSELN